ncbi:hypothetical protein BJ878DRAFT_558933 [Calycina marina]|uniref:Uncharacterized protein n=1 Tax=Calycina marina TaxID=1763456 RepID=A0A9P7Z7Q9_9HELO|nr:hypothetical protein BJ878DRAFT_558933 [Calycina marina]
MSHHSTVQEKAANSHELERCSNLLYFNLSSTKTAYQEGPQESGNGVEGAKREAMGRAHAGWRSLEAKKVVEEAEFHYYESLVKLRVAQTQLLRHAIHEYRYGRTKALGPQSWQWLSERSYDLEYSDLLFKPGAAAQSLSKPTTLFLPTNNLAPTTYHFSKSQVTHTDSIGSETLVSDFSKGLKASSAVKLRRRPRKLKSTEILTAEHRVKKATEAKELEQ